jgi:hypothetical protein
MSLISMKNKVEGKSSGVPPSRFFLKEIVQRTEEKEKEDTSGREIRHGEYFEHLDMLINRI